MNRYLSLLLLITSAGALCAADPPPRPNILLVMADDQGWGDTGYKSSVGKSLAGEDYARK